MKKMNLNSELVCRLCMQVSSDLIELIPKNGTQSRDVEDIDYILKAMHSCYGIEVRGDDNLPSTVCEKCINCLTAFYSSQQMVACVDKLLRDAFRVRRLCSYTNLPVFCQGSEADVTSHNATPQQRLSESESIVSKASGPKRKTFAWVEGFVPKKNIGTTIDKSNILPPENRREKKKTMNDEFTSAGFLSRRKKLKNEFRKLREKGAEEPKVPVQTKRGRRAGGGPPKVQSQKSRVPPKLKSQFWADAVEIVNVSHISKTESNDISLPKLDSTGKKKNGASAESVETDILLSGVSDANSVENNVTSEANNVSELEQSPDQECNDLGSTTSSELPSAPLIQDPSCLITSSSGRKLKPVARLDA